MLCIRSIIEYKTVTTLTGILKIGTRKIKTDEFSKMFIEIVNIKSNEYC